MFVVCGLFCFEDGGVSELFLQLVVGRLLRAAHKHILLHLGRAPDVRNALLQIKDRSSNQLLSGRK